MKPEPDLDISAKNVAAIHGNDVQPLSKLAAHNDKERAEHFTFTDEDRELLDKVLSEDGDQP